MPCSLGVEQITIKEGKLIRFMEEVQIFYYWFMEEVQIFYVDETNLRSKTCTAVLISCFCCTTRKRERGQNAPHSGRAMQVALALTPNEAKTLLFHFIQAYACLAASATRCLRYDQTLRYHPLVYVPLGPS